MGGKPRSKARTSTLGKPGTDGVWPMRGLKVVETDGFQRPGPGAKRNGRGHLGGDFMERRDESGDFDRPEYTRHFYCPTGTAEAIAPAHGKVWSVRFSAKNGWVVKLSHGYPHLTVYRHLARVDVVAGQEVCMAETLGIIGHAPSAGKHGVNHLHAELWDMTLPGPKNSRRAHSIDVAPWLRHWRKV